ncbi:anti-sigma factor antagonist [Mycobacterium yunnanensis]|uniref:Anti-sigma factor antagonist n=2 Tax=Mycobacterium yunnanensis TaxID=368477 RepID=A0A9X2YXA0_9MYCO|nr:anti-sigma factor antagonist [Mycobacterium yunnanensis]
MVTVLRVGGDIDLTNVAAWRCVLAEVSAVATAPGALIIDLDAAHFLGLCAFTALADTAEHCRGRGIDLRVVGTQPVVARIIGVGLWDTLLPVHATVVAAVDAWHQIHRPTGDAVANSQGS